MSAMCVNAQVVDPPAEAPSKFQYGIGLAAISSPEYEGSDRYTFKLRPLLVLQYGRFRITSAKSGAILDRSGVGDSGASADLFSNERWRASAGLRVDAGRSASDSINLAGLPSIKQTVRGRLLLSYQLTDQHRFDVALAQDLLNQRGGAIATVDWRYLQRLNPSTEWFMNAGLSAGDRTFMQSYFGIAPGSASALPVFNAASGIRDLHVATGLRYTISSRWVAFGNVTAIQLMGSAAVSPLTKIRQSGGLTIGLAYRCCGA